MRRDKVHARKKDVKRKSNWATPQQQLLDERLAAHRAAPGEARPWEDVLDDLERRLLNRPR